MGWNKKKIKTKARQRKEILKEKECQPEDKKTTFLRLPGDGGTKS